jgi:soluble lytic murein transglycosylase-like protein
MASIDKVLDRIEEISRKCATQFEPPRSLEPPKNRFVEILDAAQGKKGEIGVRGMLSSRETDAQGAIDDLRRQISRIAEEYNIDEELVRAVIQVESGWKADAVSSKGARGLMQLMPRTAAMLGVEDSFDPVQNVEGGVKYLAQLTDKYEGDVEMALAAYNAGPSRVDASGGSPYPGTSRYVQNVMALYHRYREEE